MPQGTTTAIVTEVTLDRIVPNPYQPRQTFNEHSLEELASSIRQFGVLQPLLVCKTPQGYTLIAGERRLQASKKAGLNKVPVVVKDATPKELLEYALIENIQRDDLNALEEALAYKRCMDELNLSQIELAERVGKSQAAVSNTLRLLKLPQEVKRALMEGTISEGHARALLGSKDEKTLKTTFTNIVANKSSVRETESAVRQSTQQSVASTKNLPLQGRKQKEGIHSSRPLPSIKLAGSPVRFIQDDSNEVIVRYKDEQFAEKVKALLEK